MTSMTCATAGDHTPRPRENREKTAWKGLVKMPRAQRENGAGAHLVKGQGAEGDCGTGADEGLWWEGLWAEDG